nr:MAG TPA: hypothetical protein [Caudoviricetes sp.]
MVQTSIRGTDMAQEIIDEMIRRLDECIAKYQTRW